MTTLTTPAPAPARDSWRLRAWLSIIAVFLAHLRFTGDLVDAQTRNAMDAGSLGWLNPVTFSGFVEGEFGVYEPTAGIPPAAQTGA